MPFTVVGKGTNLLVADEGYDGAVLVLGKEFRRHVIDEEHVRAGAGATLAAIVQDGFKAGLAGLAFGVGIPGTFGGALAMNAGTREGCVGDATRSVTVFVPGHGLDRLRGSEIPWCVSVERAGSARYHRGGRAPRPSRRSADHSRRDGALLQGAQG